MKKIYVFFSAALLLLFSSCDKDGVTSSDTDAQYQYYPDYDVLIKVEPLKDGIFTKSCHNSDFYGVTVSQGDAVYTETIECYKSDSYNVERHYDVDNTLIVTIINDGVSILDVIMSDEYENYAETKSLREDGEGYRACVKRVYKECREDAEDEFPILCDFTPVCKIGSAYIAIVGCVKGFME